MADIFDLFRKLSTEQPAAQGPVTHLVVGLGNIGAQYDGTLHNVGFALVDYMAGSLGVRVDRIKFKSTCGEAMIAGRRVLFLKPGTYMNLSGQAVVEAAQFHKIPPENIIVVSDDVSMAAGRLRIRLQGSHGGHNGLRNIIYLLGSDKFPRIKIGVGEKPHPDYDLADWVMTRPKGEQKAQIEAAIQNAAKAIPLLVSGEADRAMNLYNTK